MLKSHRMYKIIKLFNGDIWRSIVVGIIAALFISFIEYGFAGYLQLVFVKFGLLSAKVPLFVQPLIEFSPLSLALLLIVFGIIRAVALFFSQHCPNAFHDALLAQLRSMTIYDLLLGDSKKLLSNADVNYRFAEVYTKACNFLWLFFNAALTIVQIVILLGLMFRLAWFETSLGIIAIGVFGLGLKYLNYHILQYGFALPSAYERILRAIERVSRNRLLVYISGMRGKEFNEITRELRTYSDYSRMARGFGTFGSVLPQVLGTSIIAAILYFSHRTTLGEAGNMLTFLYLFLRLTQQGGSLVGFVTAAYNFLPGYYLALDTIDEQDLERQLSVVERGSDFHLTENHVSGSIGGTSDAFFNCDVEPPGIIFKNVSFSWSSSDPSIFGELNMQLSPGAMLGIVGPSGAGKTTILNLLFGILIPTKGEVSINSQPPHEFVSRTFRRIGYVGPDSFLFKGSVRQNLMYGNDSERSDDEIWAVLRLLGLFDEINKYPQGLAFVLDELNAPLSTGQKQRLALGRALLRNPRLLVLDEATSNLDVETEQEVAEILNRLTNSCSIVIVSHRDGILRHCDTVLRLGSAENVLINRRVG